MKQILKFWVMTVALLFGTLNVANAQPSCSNSQSVNKEVKAKSKAKTKAKGNKRNRGIIKGYFDGDTKGETVGYDFHAKKGQTFMLERVGLFVSEGENPVQKTKFRVNVYDMKGEKKSPVKNLESVLPKPIEFEYNSDQVTDGKFVLQLSSPIALPDDAMVEIEFLDNLGDKKLWYKSNLVGKKTWMKSGNEWILQPFATPFFVEYTEIKK